MVEQKLGNGRPGWVEQGCLAGWVRPAPLGWLGFILNVIFYLEILKSFAMLQRGKSLALVYSVFDFRLIKRTE